MKVNANFIKKLLKYGGLRHADAAEFLGIKTQSLSNALNSSHELGVLNLEKLSVLLNVPVVALTKKIMVKKTSISRRAKSKK